LTADVDAEDVLELAATEDQEPVEALPAHAADQRSAWAFAFGAWIGVRTISRVRVSAQERPPAGGGALRCRRDAGTGEHVPHQRRRPRDPELA
jgi:hypothetical protein